MSIKLPKIFLDSGDPSETKKAKSLLGTVDGQTTNPSLVAKNPEVQKYLASGKKLSEVELLDIYKDMVAELDKELAGPISVETYADWRTKSETMLAQAMEMKHWGKNIYLKFPTIPEGIKAAHEYVKLGGSVNMTLVFDQTQAAAVYSATLPTFKPAFISPFLGRWDDRGYRGLDLIKNIRKMYDSFNKIRNEKKNHVEVLAASIRNLDHFYGAIFLGADILTVPLTIVEEWIQDERFIPDDTYRPNTPGLRSLIYQTLPYYDDFTQYEVKKDAGTLLDEGLIKFSNDWNNLLDKN
ncbi:transaldolase [Candidatus Roizmanbacteria bacterium CG11_big_fil_rev_8_21_14_0_20_36_8]|uniref:Transaldolase n=2 Tax=Candidatus Roizmaniibacteriota TaxID=1752723 RepID=A0A2M6IU87_9BACT|nr:MAG: transaldolase [Candidatus Roizmanbacteria bacterium CG11_big_fil_rev_8_21_14_0_20_36_8]PIZ66588.1 MAG: transaldolase [Candidatus Roizmanbacteria bacterium CG_4_10_14_0_2_um_filter_36_9]